MRHFLWLLLLQGFWCYKNPLRISPNSLVAWTGSCVLIPCQIEERLNSRKIVVTSVIWYFQPILNMSLLDYVGNILYSSYRIPNEKANLSSPNFQGRVRFVGDLSKGDCSLMITQLQKEDNGTYGIKVTASVENQVHQQILYTSATLNVSDSFPKPKLEILKCQERWALKVVCSVPSHCPEDPITMNFKGPEKYYLTKETMIFKHGVLQKMITIQPPGKPRKKPITCQLSNKDNSQRSASTLELEMKNCPNDVQVFVVNDLPIKEGEIVTLNCSVGGSISSIRWYNWWKIDSHTAEYQYSSPKLLTFPASFGPVTSYKCEACNIYGCTSSTLVTLDIFFAPREVNIWKNPGGQIDEGSTVVLHCEVGEANPMNLTYTWYKDEEKILLDSPHAYLNLINIDPAQSGRYWCEASNSVGRTRSPTITLHVICFHCDENPLGRVPNSLMGWEKSCVVIPCHINQMLSVGTVNVTAIVWNFKPLGNTLRDGKTILLYNSSQTSGTVTIVSDNVLSSRTWFIGNLTNRDCSLLINPVKTLDSGTYEVMVAVSTDKYPWQIRRFLTAILTITESPPEPTMEIMPMSMEEKKITHVICSVPYHCPHVLLSLTLSGLENEHLPSQTMAVGNGVIQTTLTFEPTWKHNGKMLRCLLKSGAEVLSQSSMKLDVTYTPKDVQLVILNDLPIKEGDTVMMNCSFSSSKPNLNWYNWFKSDRSMIEYKYSGSNLLTFPATPGPYTFYECEVCNRIGCTLSPVVILEVFYAPKEVKILQKPEGRIHEFASVDLKCEVEIAEPRELTFTWYKNDELLDFTADVLTILNASHNHSGTYHCEVKNCVGSSRSPAIKLHILSSKH